MRLSNYFLPVLKETPKDAEVMSHQLMLRAGMVRQQAAGMYSWLPLGHKTLKKVQAIIEDEQHKAGAVQMLMPTLQSADLWRESGRYDDYGQEMLRIKDRHERDMLYGPTNEEMITDIFRTHVRSYKELPLNLFHVQWKFRDEIRPRFGTMRSREFLMKDGYSFDVDKRHAQQAYYKMFVAYLRTFKRMGLTAIPMKADTGPIGGDLSHEFIILAATGESEVFCDKHLLDLPTPDANIYAHAEPEKIFTQWTSYYAATDEMHNKDQFEAEVSLQTQINARGIEVGHIFYFGTKYSEAMKAMIAGSDGQLVPAQMGSYGIGLTRLVPAIIEASHDEKGIIWPKNVAPFDVGLLNLKSNDQATSQMADAIYTQLQAADLDVLYDDRDLGAGPKFAGMDLIGLPLQIAIGPRGAKSNSAEVKIRRTGARVDIGLEDIAHHVKKMLGELDNHVPIQIS